jgi:hypothetical protein
MFDFSNSKSIGFDDPSWIFVITAGYHIARQIGDLFGRVITPIATDLSQDLRLGLLSTAAIVAAPAIIGSMCCLIPPLLSIASRQRPIKIIRGPMLVRNFVDVSSLRNL